MEITPKLKQKITDRWNILSSGQMFNPFPTGQKSTAFAQLEYILIEAGLLAQKRTKNTTAQQPEQTEITL